MDSGAAVWEGKFLDFIKKTMFDPAVGYPPSTEETESPAEHDRHLDSDSAFNATDRNVLEATSYINLHGDETTDGGMVTGALGSGGKYHTGVEEF